MDLLIRKKDLYVLAAVLIGIAAVLVHHYLDTLQIEKDLHAFAQAEIDDLFGPEIDRSEWDILTQVDYAKTFHVAGPAWGAIHTFVRKKNDAEMKTFKGVEYYLKREGDSWIELDSAGCGALEHHVDGFQEFERLGLPVAANAYDKALGYRRASTDKKSDHQHGHDHDHAHDHDDHDHDHDHHDHDHKPAQTKQVLAPAALAATAK